MTDSLDHLEQRMYAVDRYVQGEMDASEVQAFEGKMAEDPSLAADVAAQRNLSLVLQLAFTPSPVPVLPPAPAAPAEPPGGAWRVPAPLLAGGAMAAVAAAAVVWVSIGSLGAPAAPVSSAVAAYQQAFQGKDQFKPQSTVDLEVAVCTKIGRNVQFGDVGEVQFGGLTGAAGTPMALGVPARAGSDQLLVIIDLAPSSGPATAELTTTQIGDHLFRHALVRNGLSLVELSPRKSPSVIQKMRIGN